ncbi:MAG: isopenicillin N synthase family oxygenase [Bacteriovoracales bacterium]|nr:isopenicillin N synthase family oxygenase [Bacteriovoracales bacterium]
MKNELRKGAKALLKRSVPELDLASYLEGHETERAVFVDRLFAGLKDYGFIILTGHTVSQDEVDEAYELTTQLFSLPREIKSKYSGESNGGQRGHTRFGQEHAVGHPYPDLKEFWHVGREVPPSHPYAQYYPGNFWPEEFPHFRRVMTALYDAMEKTADTLLKALGTALDLPPNYFSEMIHEGNSVLRLIHYPPLAQDAHPQSVRAAAHEDINLITLLVGATDSGLQLLDRNGQWLDVHSQPNQIVVDTGDMMSRITNEVIPSTTHRVTNPNNSRSRRYSMPYFVHPHPQAVLSCLPSCREGGEKYPPISSNDFLMERLKDIGLK